MLGGFASIRWNLKGPNLSAVTACAAGTHGIIDGVKAIRSGTADKMLVVAGEAAICEIGVGGFGAMKALSTRNDEPEKASRPFDRERDGFVIGEGGAALILEKFEDAVKRGAKIYGEIIGFGETGDAYHITSPAPEGEGAYRAMKMALEMAGNPKVDYINAHGTSTKYNDLFETIAIKRVFGGRENCPPVSSTKGATGHCLGAAGAIEAVISLMAMERGVIPPTINYQYPDPECDLDYVPNQPREQQLNVVMSNSFGFGGTNGVLIFKKV
jgi:3-oxoacyl-[acyl-carrier-protein] synthase II